MPLKQLKLEDFPQSYKFYKAVENFENGLNPEQNLSDFIELANNGNLYALYYIEYYKDYPFYNKEENKYFIASIDFRKSQLPIYIITAQNTKRDVNVKSWYNTSVTIKKYNTNNKLSKFQISSLLHDAKYCSKAYLFLEEQINNKIIIDKKIITQFKKLEYKSLDLYITSKKPELYQKEINLLYNSKKEAEDSQTRIETVLTRKMILNDRNKINWQINSIFMGCIYLPLSFSHFDDFKKDSKLALTQYDYKLINCALSNNTKSKFKTTFTQDYVLTILSNKDIIEIKRLITTLKNLAQYINYNFYYDLASAYDYIHDVENTSKYFEMYYKLTTNQTSKESVLSSLKAIYCKKYGHPILQKEYDYLKQNVVEGSIEEIFLNFSLARNFNVISDLDKDFVISSIEKSRPYIDNSQLFLCFYYLDILKDITKGMELLDGYLQTGNDHEKSNIALFLGNIYEQGMYGKTQSYKEAYQYYKLSAKLGNADGMSSQGSLLKQGLGVEKNINKANRILIQATIKGSTLAYYNLSLIMFDKKNYDQALIYAHKAEILEDEDVYYHLGLIYQLKYYKENFNNKKDTKEQNTYYQKAIEYFQKASEMGSNQAIVSLCGCSLNHLLNQDKINKKQISYFIKLLNKPVKELMTDALVLQSILYLLSDHTNKDKVLQLLKETNSLINDPKINIFYEIIKKMPSSDFHYIILLSLISNNINELSKNQENDFQNKALEILNFINILNEENQKYENDQIAIDNLNKPNEKEKLQQTLALQNITENQSKDNTLDNSGLDINSEVTISISSFSSEYDGSSNSESSEENVTHSPKTITKNKQTKEDHLIKKLEKEKKYLELIKFIDKIDQLESSKKIKFDHFTKIISKLSKVMPDNQCVITHSKGSNVNFRISSNNKCMIASNFHPTHGNGKKSDWGNYDKNRIKNLKNTLSKIKRELHTYKSSIEAERILEEKTISL